MRYLSLQQALLNDSRRIMRPIQNSDVFVSDALSMQSNDALRDPCSFIFRRGCVVPHCWSACLTLGNKAFLHPNLILVDQRIRNGKDKRDASIIPQKHDGFHRWEDLIEIKQETAIGTSPGIDGLVGITHDEQIAVKCAKNLYQAEQLGIHVLVLVDHDVFETLLPFSTDLGTFAKDMQDKGNEVVVV